MPTGVNIIKLGIETDLGEANYYFKSIQLCLKIIHVSHHVRVKGSGVCVCVCVCVCLFVSLYVSVCRDGSRLLIELTSPKDPAHRQNSSSYFCINLIFPSICLHLLLIKRRVLNYKRMIRLFKLTVLIPHLSSEPTYLCLTSLLVPLELFYFR